jgi:hypothetical protein
MTARPHPAAAHAAAARLRAGQLHAALDGGPGPEPAGRHVTVLAAAAVGELAAAAAVLAGTARHPGAAANLRQGAAAAAAPGRLGAPAWQAAAPAAPAAPGADGDVLRAAAGAHAAAAQLHEAARRDPPPAGAWLVDDIAAAVRLLGSCMEDAALHQPPSPGRDQVHAAALLTGHAAGQLEDASTRLQLETMPTASRRDLAALGGWPLPPPAAFTLPGEPEIACHVRYQQAAALYRAGQPPRDDQDRAWFTVLAADDLAEAWHAGQLVHFQDTPGGSTEHASCPPDRCPLSGDPPADVPGAARAALRLARINLERHFTQYPGHAASCPPGHCPWEETTLPGAERAAAALERLTRPPGSPALFPRSRPVHRRTGPAGTRPAARRPL